MITAKQIQKAINEYKDIVGDEPNSFQKAVLVMLENTPNPKLRRIKDRLEFNFKDLLKAYKVPKQDLDSRTCDFEESNNIKAHYVSRRNLISIPIK